MNLTLEQLADYGPRSLVITYNADSPDTLSLELAPEHYAKLPAELSPGERLTLTKDGEVIFSGIVPLGASCSAQASRGETVSVELQSDYYILENTVYAQLSEGRAIFARTPVNSETTTLSAVVDSVSNWLGDRLPSRLTCAYSGIIPTPTSNGTAPCSALISSAMRWAPKSIITQRYSASGNTLQVGYVTGPPVYLTTDDRLTSVSFRPRHDLQATTCALVGAVHRVWPDTGDVRDIGAFVYAVPLPRDSKSEQLGGAGDAPASTKMVVRGVALPERRTFKRSPEEYNTETPDDITFKFMKRFFPELAADTMRPFIKAGACLVSLTDKAELQESLEEDDPDAKAPDNYISDLDTWQLANLYVHTEGSFPASSRNNRNVRGLRWCKAQLSMVFSVQANVSMSKEVRALFQEVMPGRLRKQNGNTFYYVRKTLACNIINRRRRVYDPATNKLWPSDPDYAERLPEDEENAESATLSDYVAAMEQYYNEASQLQHEGSVSLLYDGGNVGGRRPWDMTGRTLQVGGLRPEWATMSAAIRSVQWDINGRTLSITAGPRATLGFSELLERRVIARNRGRDEAERSALRYDPSAPEKQAEAEEVMSVSPSISAATDTESSGRWHKPFTLYIREGDSSGTVMLAGGTLQRGGQTWNVEDSDAQIIDGQPTGPEWVLGQRVRLRWKKDGELITYDIYQ